MYGRGCGGGYGKFRRGRDALFSRSLAMLTISYHVIGTSYFTETLSLDVYSQRRGVTKAIIYAQPGRKKIRYRIMCSFPIALSASLSQTEDPLGL